MSFFSFPIAALASSSITLLVLVGVGHAASAMPYWSRVTRLISWSALRTRDPARLSCLTAVTFLGDAPKAGEEVFTKAPSTIYRKPEAKGWGETWGGRPVKLISEKP